MPLHVAVLLEWLLLKELLAGLHILRPWHSEPKLLQVAKLLLKHGSHRHWHVVE